MQDDSARMIDEIFSFDPSSVTASILGVPPPTRRGSAPLNAPFCNGSTKGHPQRALTFPRDNSNFGSHMQCVSAFDLAPLNHPNYVNLATLSMPLEDDVASFYSPRSNIPSPSFPPVQATADLPPVGLFSVDSTMSSVPEEFTEERVIIKDDPYSEEPFEASDLPELREQGETTPQPTSASNTGISMEEITSFISGPETSDGKWVCKFPECDKRFGRKENIKSHVQTHLGDRQYRCEVCKKCFVRQHDLKRHSKIHTGIKPYPCLCGNSFARHDALTRHRQRGMCIGAFEGIVKKVAKRGRPRKKQLDEDGNELVRPDKISDQEPSLSSASSSASSSSSRSDVSDPRTPTALDCASPSPDSPNFDQYDSSASSTGRSIKEESPELLPSFGSPVDTPPTSPPDSGGFGHFSYKLDAKRSSHGSSFPEEDIYRYREIDYSDFGLPIPEDDVKFGSGSDYSSDFSQGSNAADEYMFSQADGLMFTLTTLEQNPNILGGLGGEDNYIKPELLSNP